jgi:hypothetical protein
MAFSSNGEVVRVARGVPPVSDETEKTGGTPVPLFQPLDQDGLIVKHRRTLPHWEQALETRYAERFDDESCTSGERMPLAINRSQDL